MLAEELQVGSYGTKPCDDGCYDDGFDGLDGVVWTVGSVGWIDACCNCVAGFGGDDLSSEWP